MITRPGLNLPLSVGKLNRVHKRTFFSQASDNRWCTTVVPEKRDDNEVSLIIA